MEIPISYSESDTQDENFLRLIYDVVFNVRNIRSISDDIRCYFILSCYVTLSYYFIFSCYFSFTFWKLNLFVPNVTGNSQFLKVREILHVIFSAHGLSPDYISGIPNMLLTDDEI